MSGSEDAAEIAARTVNKERARQGGAGVVAALAGGHLVRPPGRAPLRRARVCADARATSSTRRRGPRA